MRFNVISNLKNGAGLQRNYELLKHALEVRGHYVYGVQFNEKHLRTPPADVNIFDEVVNPNAFPAAPVQWVMPHPEWWFQGWERYHWDKVLCKTRDCERIFREKVGDRSQYIGWLANDLYNPDIKREKKFLHVAGKSHFKNTDAVIQGCLWAGVQLTLVGEVVNRRVEDWELVRLMNSHFCQIMPSEYEGYGHVLHESQSTGQILITTDAPPMNLVKPSFVIPSISTRQHHAGTLHKVSPLDVCRTVKRVLALPDNEVERLRLEARQSYFRGVKEFHVALSGLVGV